MAIFKFLVSSFLALSPSQADEWVSVEKKTVVAQEVYDEDDSTWVLFSKKLGDERVTVRFPGEPTYQYRENLDLEVTQDSGAGFFQLVVEPRGESEMEDQFYFSEGKWVREHFVRTADHLYRLKAVFFSLDDLTYQDFFSSFSIEKI